MLGLIWLIHLQVLAAILLLGEITFEADGTQYEKGGMKKRNMKWTFLEPVNANKLSLPFF